MFQHRYPEITDLAGVPAGQMVPVETLLPRMRLSQLLDLARAYEMKVNFNSTKPKLLPVMEAAAQEGVFQRQPKHPYYLARAYYNSDDTKVAKSKMGDPESGPPLDPRQIPAQLKPWHGPLDEAPAKVAPIVKAVADDAKKADLAAVKERARALGVRIQGKTPQGLKAAIRHAEKKLAAQESDDAGEIDQGADEPGEAAA